MYDLVYNDGKNLPEGKVWTIGRNGQKKEVSAEYVIQKYIERKVEQGEFIASMKAIADSPVAEPILDILGAVTPHKKKLGSIGGVVTPIVSMSDSGTIKFCMEVDLKTAKSTALNDVGAILGEGTDMELALDLDTGKGHFEVTGDHTVLSGKVTGGAKIIKGKMKAIAGLFRKDRKTTKAGQNGTNVPDYNKDSSIGGKDSNKAPEESWGDYFQKIADSYMDAENLKDRTWLGKNFQKAIGSQFGAMAETAKSSGVEATWRVALGFDMNWDGSGTGDASIPPVGCDDDCAAGQFEEDPWSATIEADIRVAAYTKIYGNEHRVQGGVGVSGTIDGNGKITVAANLKAQHIKNGFASTWKASAKAYGGGGGPTGFTATTGVSEALQDGAFARAPNGAPLKVVERPS